MLEQEELEQKRDKLVNVFPNIDPWIIEDIIEGLKGDLDAIIDKLSSFSEEVSPEPPQQNFEPINTEREDNEFISILCQMFPEIASSELQTVAKHYKYDIIQILGMLIQGEEDHNIQTQQNTTNTPTKLYNRLDFQDGEERESFEYLLDLLPQGTILEPHIRSGILDLLRWHGEEHIAKTIVYAPESIENKIKAMRKKKKKNRQFQNKSQHKKLQANTGHGNSFTSQWNTGDLVANSSSITSLKDSIEYPRGTKLQNTQDPGIWNNSTISRDMKLQKLKEKYPQLDEDLLFDILQSGATEYAEEHLVNILALSSDNINECEEVFTLPKAFHNPEHKPSPGNIRYVPPVKRDKGKYVQIEVKKRRRNKKANLPAEDISSDDARGEAMYRGQLMQTYLRCAAAAFQSGRMDKAREYADKGKQMKNAMDEYNHLASQLIIQSEQSFHLDDGVLKIDLHGLYVQEALEFVEETFQRIHSSAGDKRPRILEIVTGIGNRSGNTGPRIKPAVIGFLKSKQIAFTANEGSIVVRLPS